MVICNHEVVSSILTPGSNKTPAQRLFRADMVVVDSVCYPRSVHRERRWSQGRFRAASSIGDSGFGACGLIVSVGCDADLGERAGPKPLPIASFCQDSD